MLAPAMSLLVSPLGAANVASHAAPSIVVLVEEALRAQGVDLARLGMAWARVTPTVTLVPAFGLKALPTAARGVLGLALAAAIFPAMPPAGTYGGPLWIGLLDQVLIGLPVAIAAAVPLWAATMAGNVADSLRGSNDTTPAPTVEGNASPMGIAFSLLACTLFFASGGPARVASALALPPSELHPVLRATQDLTSGIEVAIALGAPLLAASVVIEVAGALIARAATPAQLHLVLAPLRALALLGVLALVFGAMSEALAAVVAHARV
jgi:flagellar biosynthetic protein FliR